MSGYSMRGLVAACAILGATLAAHAEDAVRVGVLKFGTVNWEMDVIKTHELDKKHGFDLQLVETANNEATKIGLEGGSVDLIVSDWLWVSRQRTEGGDLTFVPFSSSVGAVMVPPDSAAANLGDLKGKKIGVAGGPLDKNWLMIQAVAKKDHGIDLARDAEPVFGAPPLLAEKIQQGELDAVLNFWHYCAKLEAMGYKRLYSGADAAEALGAAGDVAAIGYVFHDKFANEHEAAMKGFVAASREAKEIMKTSDEEWERLRPVIKPKDDKELAALRQRFREGIPERPLPEEVANARKIYQLMAELGGKKLVGSGTELAEGTYWPGQADAM
ncbi:alkanesulfonate transporter substrate-binding subunit [Hartmannibacter diazotrophicus]|uniref:Alkanesulfonate transporter substrate-binding subunit n=1 Tax=Hartmannibacter diazotrophicus TaxID=1482074 RepID=A0A2C9D6B8_9HYPH|nr:ABC transporter substrate-binding protein [Hartmannibacter diazotrophicus]SON55872.1 alkanesulfonate transporter substrate-binding subunit [Hartmannibacter diazotrophicus]